MALVNQYAEAGSEVIEVHSISVDPASVLTLAQVNVDIAIAGILTTDRVIALNSNGLTSGLIWKEASIPTDGTLRVVVANISAGTIDGAAIPGFVTIVRSTVVFD